MIVVKADDLTSLALGRQGENLARQVVFDLSDWTAEYGDGTAELIYQRPGDAAPYPVAAVREGDTLLWTPTATDTAKESTIAVGSGHCELRWYVGDILAKSKIWRTWVEPAMDTPSETTPPEPEMGWVDQVLAAGAAAMTAADGAKADADRAAALAAEVSKKAAQTAHDASDAAKAMEAAQTAQRLAEEAQGAAEAARTAAAAAQAAAEQSATDAAGAKQDAETALQSAQDAAAAAANALESIQTLYQEMQTWAQGVIQDVNAAGSAAVQSVQSAGDAQVQRVTDEGETQTANAKAQADSAAQSAAGAAQSAQQAEESAAVYDDVVADVNQLKGDLVDTESKISALFVYSRNLLDVSAMVSGYFVNQGNGELNGNNAHSVTELMKIDPNTTFTYSNESNLYDSIRIAFYDRGKKFISGILGKTTFTSPTEAVYMRISDLTKRLKGDAQLEYGSEKTDYVPYRKQIESSLVDSYTKDEVNAQLLAIRDRKIKPGNTTFFWVSPNLFDRGTTIRGYFVNQGNGELIENANYVCSDFIGIDQNTDYTFSGDLGSGHRYAFYDANHEYITGALNAGGISPYTVTSPNGAAYIRFSIYFKNYDSGGHQFEKGSEATAFAEYGSAHLLPEYAPVNDEFLLNLPSKLYALVGEELNIYFDNLVDGHDADYVFDVESNVGMQLDRCFRFEPTEAGSYPIAISATNRDGWTVRKNSTIYVAAAGAGSDVSRSLIVLGDSTTNNGIAVTKLNTNFATDVMDLRTVGTRGTGANMHEGRSGWTFRNFFTIQQDSGAPDVFNPFFNPDTQTFDASYYFANSGVEKPDWFFINLGINDVFSYSQDSILAGEIEGLNSMCDAMISSIMEASPETKVGVALTIPPNYSQDAFGKAYKCGQSRARYKRNNVIWVDNLIRRYENREEEGIYLIPIHTNLDTKFNMGMETNYHNKRNTTMTYESPIRNGGVHPVDSGYWQIADVYWFFLKNMEA